MGQQRRRQNARKNTGKEGLDVWFIFSRCWYYVRSIDSVEYELESDGEIW